MPITYKAVVYNNRTEWYLHGKLHRVDGPAIEWEDGSKSWWINGELHREDGPAVEWADGRKIWYLNGEKLTEEQFNARDAPCDGATVVVNGKKYKLVACGPCRRARLAPCSCAQQP